MQQDKRDIKQMIIIRKDLKMRRGKEISQGCHACLGLILDAQRRGTITKAMKLWMDPDSQYSFKKVCVYVESEGELLALAHQAYANKVPCKIITDAGHTEFNGVPTITCMALGPDYEDRIDEITEELPLL